MTSVTFTQFRSNMAQLMDQAENDFDPVVVSRPKGKKSVVLPYDEYQSLIETAYLLKDPANRKHLEQSLQEVEENNFVRFAA